MRILSVINSNKQSFYSPRRCGLAVFVCLALGLAALPTRSAYAQNDGAAGEDDQLYSCGKAKGQVSVSFKPEIELKDLLTWAMGFTCKNFIYSSSIGGRSSKVTIIAPKKMSPQQAWRLFLVALANMNLSVVPKGNVLKLVEAPQAKNESLPIYKKNSAGDTDDVVRVIIRPSHVNVDELTNALNILKSKDGVVTSLPRAGVIVVTDYASHIKGMNSLMRDIDQPVAGERLYMIKVQYADAVELAAKLTDILGTRDPNQGPAGAPPQNTRGRNRGNAQAAAPAPRTSVAEVESAVPSKLTADERSNSLILLSSEPAYLRVRSLVKRLDISMDVEGGGRIHVYYLENANAEEMANTLNSVITGATPQTAGQAGRPARAPTPAPRPPSASGDAGSTFEGKISLTHDKPTNALVVVASVKDFLALREVVRKLDVPRRQVFIEAVILEVKSDNSLDIGTSFHGGDDRSDGSIVIGGVQHPNLQSLNVASVAGLSGLLGGLIGPILPNSEQLLGTSIPSFGVLFQALANASNVNVLSSPHILTTDNEAAEISVGENIPYQSSFSNFGGAAGGQQAGGFGLPVQSVQRQDVALTLKITPHVNASDMVRLEIDQEISDIASPNFEGLGPSWAKRTIKTTVVVRDQQSIVIGGLMSDRYTYTEAKVPLLGDIPLLGYLFKYTQKSKAKTNLLVLLTPYVIKDQMDIEQIVQRKVRERNEFMRTFSNFGRMGFRAQIDYRRKHGLVEDINRTVESIERDQELLKQLEGMGHDFPDGPIEYDPASVDSDGSDDEGDDEDSDADGGGAVPAAGGDAKDKEPAAGGDGGN